MAEYIERKRAIVDACNSLELYPSEYAKLEDALTKIPAADVAPVRHGHWVSLTDCSNAGVYCSNCHKKVYKEDYALCNRKNKLRSNYCPNCGADMRESKEE